MSCCGKFSIWILWWSQISTQISTIACYIREIQGILGFSRHFQSLDLFTGVLRRFSPRFIDYYHIRATAAGHHQVPRFEWPGLDYECPGLTDQCPGLTCSISLGPWSTMQKLRCSISGHWWSISGHWRSISGHCRVSRGFPKASAIGGPWRTAAVRTRHYILKYKHRPVMMPS